MLFPLVFTAESHCQAQSQLILCLLLHTADLFPLKICWKFGGQNAHNSVGNISKQVSMF